jgi:hypothetical protein
VCQRAGREWCAGVIHRLWCAVHVVAVPSSSLPLHVGPHSSCVCCWQGRPAWQQCPCAATPKLMFAGPVAPSVCMRMLGDSPVAAVVA